MRGLNRITWWVALALVGCGQEAVDPRSDDAAFLDTADVAGDLADAAELDADPSTDGGADTPLADALQDPDGSLDAPPDAAECATDEEFFAERIWAGFGATVCSSCHRVDGLAGGTRLLLIPDAGAEALAANFDAFSALANDPVGRPLLLLKPIDEHAERHTGGQALNAESQEYADLVEFVSRVTGEIDPCDSVGPIEDPCLDHWPGPRSTRMLTRAEYRESVAAILGSDQGWGARLSPEPVVDGFDNHADSLVATPLRVEQWLQAAQALVEPLGLAELRALGGCGAGEGSRSCATAVIERFGRRAFRRPVAAVEVARYESLFADSEGLSGEEAGLEDVVSAMLISPNFLYRTELGEERDGAFELTQHELAASLSYMITGAPPDEALASDADAGSLTPGAISDHARRLIAAEEAERSTLHFFTQWLELEALSRVSRDDEVYPAFSEDIRGLMAAELDRFLLSTAAQPSGTLVDLLTATHSFATPELASYYGWSGGDAPDSEGWSRYELDGERVGILTQGALLTTQSLPTSGSPIHRGKLVRERLLCQPLPPPPPGISADPPALDPELTTRERFTQHATDPICAGCHDLVDPIGFAFEEYDGVGIFREDENGLPIDTRGEIIDSPHTSLEFDGMSELADILSVSEDVADCYAEQWFRFSFGVAPEPYSCSVESVVAEAAAGGGELEAILVALTQTPHFYYRAPDGMGPGEWADRDGPEPGDGGDVGGDVDGGADVGPDAVEDVEPHVDVEPDLPPVVDELLVDFTISSDWGAGYCAGVVVTNAGESTIEWAIELEVEGTINDFWNSTLEQDGSTAFFRGAHWNESLAPGTSTDFGFCAAR